MNVLRSFDYYLKKGIVRKKTKNKARANFLEKEAKLSFEGLIERVELMGINKKNSNSIIKDCYDIILETIRSKMILSGYYASGQGHMKQKFLFREILLKKKMILNF